MVNCARDAGERSKLVSCNFTMNTSELAHKCAFADRGKSYQRNSGIAVLYNIKAIAGDTDKGRVKMEAEMKTNKWRVCDNAC